MAQFLREVVLAAYFDLDFYQTFFDIHGTLLRFENQYFSRQAGSHSRLSFKMIQAETEKPHYPKANMSNEPAIVSQLHMLAAYYQWANAALAHHVTAVAEEHYFAPAGLYFNSIHGTLNHLLLADRSWYGRFAGKPEAFTGLGQEIQPDRHALLNALTERGNLWRELIDNTSAVAMAGDLHYTTMAGQPSITPWTGTLTHVFNHATHHRGQITAAMTRYGYGCPELDLIYYLRS